ncbi:hypothetical protein [Noviherbaspirillum massiliense]|uniref:hypothetical protein n=1 Tax=Noviherbaspirillum massiliense TaxID=1465823 RepID=UPI0011DD2ED4|nr:hypothetical protein [Noviherbaspirillum massiliense]
MALAGYANRRTLTSVDGHLTANFACLSDNDSNEIIVGSIDTLFISKKLLEDINKKTGSSSKLLLFSTHTHNAPSLANELPLLGEVNPVWYAEVLDLLAYEINKLRHRPAVQVTVSYGEKNTDLNVNRRKNSYALDYRKLARGKFSFGRKICLAPNKHGVIDHRVRLFSFESETGTRCILWSFAAHAAFYPNHRSVSADFPGAIREKLHEIYGDQCCIIYVPGLAGSAIPYREQGILVSPKTWLARLLPFHPALPGYSVKSFKRWTARLMKAIQSACDNRKPICQDGKISLREEIIPNILVSHDRKNGVDLMASYLSLGANVGLLAYSGEMLGEWSQYLMHLPLDRIIATGYAGGDCLYIPPSSELSKGGYEVDGFKFYFSLDGSFQEDITDCVVKATEGLVSNEQVDNRRSDPGRSYSARY